MNRRWVAPVAAATVTASLCAVGFWAVAAGAVAVESLAWTLVAAIVVAALVLPIRAFLRPYLAPARPATAPLELPASTEREAA